MGSRVRNQATACRLLAFFLGTSIRATTFHSNNAAIRAGSLGGHAFHKLDRARHSLTRPHLGSSSPTTQRINSHVYSWLFIRTNKRTISAKSDDWGISLVLRSAGTDLQVLSAECQVPLLHKVLRLNHPHLHPCLSWLSTVVHNTMRATMTYILSMYKYSIRRIP
jgi:hypothetical protein